MCICNWGDRLAADFENDTDRTRGEGVELNRRQLLHRGAIAGGLIVAAPLLFPRRADAQFLEKPSEAKQKEMGHQAERDVLKQYKVVKDSRAREFERIGSRLIDALPQDLRRTWDFSFRVLDSKELNAFALPGGPMFLFTGLYKEFETEDELAAVTGHELAHVYKEHWAKQVKKSQQNALLGVGLAAVIGGKGGALAGGLTASMLSSKFSRSEEDESDKLGLRNLIDAKFNPDGMVDLFNTLSKGGGKESKATAFLSSHPMTEDRLRNTKNRIAEEDGPFPKKTPLRQG